MAHTATVANMTDPLLSAWTRQYTNSPVPSAMVNPCEQVPRRKTARSCLHCQRAHRTCDNERPCQQCRRRDMTEDCVDGSRKQPKYLIDSAYKPRVWKKARKTQRDNHCSEKSTTAFIDPSVLSLGDQSQKSSPEVDDITIMRSIRPGKSSVSTAEDNSPGNGSEVLAFDIVRPEVSDGDGCSENETERVPEGFVISAGWSSTFLPPVAGYV
ncbi:hypothetical protein BDV18DRAFT_141386 [Aspergillus unguis]